MYAIVETGGKQYRVEKGDTLRIERLSGEEGGEVVFDSVLAARTEEGFKMGTPTLEGAKVTARIVSHGRGPKLRVFKFKRRKGYRKRIGHRQGFTEIQIQDIALS